MMIAKSTAKICLKKLAKTLALGAVLTMGIATAAHADRDDRGHDRGRHDRDWHDHAYGHYRAEPGYVYAPPVVYAPPPEAPGINLILPIHFH